MHKTLVILAAGIGSRFGNGIKQLEHIDDRGHVIVDYSIHDAIIAGFNKIIFIIRHNMEYDFKNIIGDRIESTATSIGVEVAYAYQEITDIPDYIDKKKITHRNKPWGTGHAVLACAGLIDSSFAVINADDYYGKNGFKKAAEFLSLHPDSYALIGYRLKNTLSDYGGVTRGICSVINENLVSISETKNIIKTANGVEAEGKFLDIDSLVSMNFWCYPADFLNILKIRFPKFLNQMTDSLRDEYLLPVIADDMLKEGIKFTVLATEDLCFGITHKEDKSSVIHQFKKLIDHGVYGEDLYSDLM